MPYQHNQENYDKAAETGCLVCVIACIAVVALLVAMIIIGMQAGEIHY